MKSLKDHPHFAPDTVQILLIGGQFIISEEYGSLVRYFQKIHTAQKDALAAAGAADDDDPFSFFHRQIHILQDLQ